MQKTVRIRKAIPAAITMALIVGFTPVRAHAASKEIIQLQTQVQQLLDMVQRIQSTLDTRFGVLQNLAQQTADQATQMSATVTALQQKINAQNDALGGKIDTTSGQIQSLNDSVDELKTRIAKLDKNIQDLQSQLQNIQNPQASPAGIAPAAPGMPVAGQQAPGFGSAATPGTTSPSPQMNQAPMGPPLEQTFQAALRDFNAAKYSVAKSEFQDVVHYYPLDNLAGTSQFYLGEIAYRQKQYESAISNYNAVLESFPGNAKAAAAQLHKGLALMLTGRREAGIHELRELIQRHPQTPEAAQARSKLNGMGVRINPRN